MSCRNCENYDPEECECTLQGGGRDPDGAGTQGCPYWEPVSEHEEERREAYGCIVMFLLLPVLLILKLI
ncbi:MAG: hypothetical protein IJT68_07710 [Lentisphaeria bacterium]|nr:hypothetical protein [Lentisphaeria bacterium]